VTARAGQAGAAAPSRRSFNPAEVRMAALCLAMPVGAVLAFSALPVVLAVSYSVTDYQPLKASPRWVGLENFVYLAEDAHFQRAIVNTAYYMLGVVPGSLLVGLLAALAFNRQLPFMALFRVSYYVPSLASIVAISLFWSWILDPQWGLLNTLIGWLGVRPQRWLLEPALAMPSLILMAIWRGAGYAMVIFLAGLQTIPQHLYDAAAIDGAGHWRRFTHVTLPLLRPTTTFLFVTSTLGAFQVFEQVYVMTQGGPAEATTTIVHQIYQQAFSFLHMGYASAQAVVLFLGLAALTVVNVRLLARDIDY
jgi:ABC-type sugar transport system permease subunit